MITRLGFACHKTKRQLDRKANLKLEQIYPPTPANPFSGKLLSLPRFHQLSYLFAAKSIFG